jgi:hypothetical protein
MTRQFHYTSRKEMEPRPGTNFATTYYKQTQAEYNRLRQHIYLVGADMMARCDGNADHNLWAQTPMKAYRKSVRGQYYTPMEIVTDMLEQFSKQKDIPSGMLGRWNKLFAGTEWDFQLVSGTPARETTFGQLFDAGNNPDGA